MICSNMIFQHLMTFLKPCSWLHEDRIQKVLIRIFGLTGSSKFGVFMIFSMQLNVLSECFHALFDWRFLWQDSFWLKQITFLSRLDYQCWFMWFFWGLSLRIRSYCLHSDRRIFIFLNVLNVSFLTEYRNYSTFAKFYLEEMNIKAQDFNQISKMFAHIFRGLNSGYD